MIVAVASFSVAASIVTTVVHCLGGFGVDLFFEQTDDAPGRKLFDREGLLTCD